MPRPMHSPMPPHGHPEQYPPNEHYATNPMYYPPNAAAFNHFGRMEPPPPQHPHSRMMMDNHHHPYYRRNEDEYAYAAASYGPPAFVTNNPSFRDYYATNNVSPCMPPMQRSGNIHMNGSPHDHHVEKQHHHPSTPASHHQLSMPATCDKKQKEPKEPQESDADQKEEKKEKKPPRPYTEYNIFFQLERERILAELEKEQQNKSADDKSNIDAVKDCPVKETSRTSSILNQPSDPSDILPRPSQFAHLKLSEYWYDSTYRLRQSKLTKHRRKHRKTHGLVGFLDLTRRIAKAWSEADEETKGYCKRVADRQLSAYKNELKQLKKPTPQLPQSVKSQDSINAHVRDTKQASVAHVPSYPMPSLDYARRGTPHHDMPPPRPPPPPPSQHAPHYGYKYQNTPWQHVPPDPRMARERYCPVVPALSPAEEYQDRRYAVEGSSMHPLDELMHRRKMYGSKITSLNKNKTTRPRKENAKAVAPHGHGVSSHTSNKDTPKAEDMVDSTSDAASYLSPQHINDSETKHDTAAITPSPNTRRKETPERKEDHLPMKKRHKKLGVDEDFAMSPGSFATGSPGSMFSPSLFSPSEIMTPGDGMDRCMASPSDATYEKALEPFIGDSPFPYIDMSPNEGRDIGTPNQRGTYHASPSGVMNACSHAIHRPPPPMHLSLSPGVPPHLAVPGSMRQHAPYRFPASSFDNWAVDDDCSESDALDLDEEEMQMMWRKLKTHAKRRRQRVAAAWANSVDGGVPSPGVLYSHSFSSPVESPEAAVTKK